MPSHTDLLYVFELTKNALNDIKDLETKMEKKHKKRRKKTRRKHTCNKRTRKKKI
jgi:hypothetical protein